MKKKEIFHDGIVPIIISVLTLITSVFLSMIQDKAGWVIVFISLLFIGILCLLLYRLFVFPILDRIEKIEIKGDNGSDLTILTEQQMIVFEDEVDLKELWIITSDLSFDCDNSLFEDITSKNLNRGIKYIYFIQETQVTRSRIQQLKQVHKNNNNLAFAYLPENFFFFAPNLDCVLHFYKTDRANDGFMGFTMNQKRYYIKMSNELFHATYGNLFQYVEM